LTGRAATVTGVLIGLVLVLLAGTALVVTRSGSGGAPETDERVPVTEGHDHVDVDPVTDAPRFDRCGSAPEMCGEDAGRPDDACDDSAMCGDVGPDTDSQEIDAGTGACTGELCGDIGPGEDDGTGP
jgi:hypothetical protein